MVLRLVQMLQASFHHKQHASLQDHHSLDPQVNCCYLQGVFHRALNMGNLLVEPQKSGPMVLKISDFAYSKNALLDSRPKTMIGELTFTCPELLLGLRTEDGQDTGRYTSSAASSEEKIMVQFIALVKMSVEWAVSCVHAEYDDIIIIPQ